MWGHARLRGTRGVLRLSVTLITLLGLVGIACSDGNDTNDATIACNDGTGESNCCNPSAKEDGHCSSNGLQCWHPCMGGGHTEMTCNGTTWSAGKGLFPCGAPK